MSVTEPFFVGRENELNDLLNDLNTDQSVRLILGEAGIGKSALLTRFYNILNDDDPSRLFIGYYKDELTSASPIHPFITVLRDLILWIQDRERLSEKMRGTMKKIVKATVEFARSKGTEIVGAILKDIAKDVGLVNTYDVMKEFLDTYKGQKSAVSLAQDFISAHDKESIILPYLGIFEALADEFNDRKFILIFDQFESAGKTSFDLLIDFISKMPKKRFHVVVSFKAEEPESNDRAAVELYQDAEKRLRRKGARILRLKGLTHDEIRDWIKSFRDTPSSWELNKIIENSAGNPMILHEWIDKPGDLDYNKISRERLCDYIIDRRESLKDERYIIYLDKLSVLAYPIEDVRNLAKFLGIPEDQIDYLQQFLRRLNEKGIFERNELDWFKHELVRKCLEDKLPDQFRKLYHSNAAQLYLTILEDNKESDVQYNIKLGCAYHLHKAGIYEKSYNRNKDLAQYASKLGDLDRAERCYRTAIEDAKALKREYDEKKCIFEMTTRVLMIWGRYDEAYQNYKNLEEYFSLRADVNLLPKVIFYLATIRQYKGEYDEALKLYEKSMSMAMEREVRSGRDTVASEEMYEKTLGLRDDYERMEGLYSDSLLFRTQLIHNLNIGMTAFEIANILYGKGKIANALRWYTLAQMDAELQNDQLVKVIAITQLARIYHDQDRYDKALELYGEILEGLSDTERLRKCLVLFEMASILLSKDEYSKALELYNQSLQIARDLKDEVIIAATLHQLGNIHFRRREFSTAMEQYDESLKIKSLKIREAYDELDKLSKGITLAQMGRMMIQTQLRGVMPYMWLQNLKEALRYIWQAHTLFENIDYPYYTMTGKDLETIQQRLGKEEYEKTLSEIKNHH
jgi:tetratricopeptide (TPR) repeat protein